MSDLYASAVGTTVLQVTEIPPRPVALAADVFYDERPYEGRGWCSFESAVSGELVVRLQLIPSLRDALHALPPKMLSLSSERPPQEVDIRDTQLASRVTSVVNGIQKATFTRCASFSPPATHRLPTAYPPPPHLLFTAWPTRQP